MECSQLAFLLQILANIHKPVPVCFAFGPVRYAIKDMRLLVRQ
jgi:hypothetical protein